MLKQRYAPRLHVRLGPLYQVHVLKRCSRMTSAWTARATSLDHLAKMTLGQVSASPWDLTWLGLCYLRAYLEGHGQQRQVDMLPGKGVQQGSSSMDCS